MRERRALGQSLCMVLGLSMVRIPGLGHDMAWGLDTGWRRCLVPGRYDGLDISWDWGQVLDMGVDPDMNWDWGLVHGRSECRGPGYP